MKRPPHVAHHWRSDLDSQNVRLARAKRLGVKDSQRRGRWMALNNPDLEAPNMPQDHWREDHEHEC